MDATRKKIQSTATLSKQKIQSTATLSKEKIQSTATLSKEKMSATGKKLQHSLSGTLKRRKKASKSTDATDAVDVVIHDDGDIFKTLPKDYTWVLFSTCIHRISIWFSPLLLQIMYFFSQVNIELLKLLLGHFSSLKWFIVDEFLWF